MEVQVPALPFGETAGIGGARSVAPSPVAKVHEPKSGS
jgi:hypothetical protein